MRPSRRVSFPELHNTVAVINAHMNCSWQRFNCRPNCVDSRQLFLSCGLVKCFHFASPVCWSFSSLSNWSISPFPWSRTSIRPPPATNPRRKMLCMYVGSVWPSIRTSITGPRSYFATGFCAAIAARMSFARDSAGLHSKSWLCGITCGNLHDVLYS